MSAHTFRIGEKALAIFSPMMPGWALHYVGTTVTVRSTLAARFDVTGIDCYLVECFDGIRAWVAPVVLQKLPPADPAFVKWRDALVREFAMNAPVRATHPAIVGMLELVGQSPLQTAREALAK